MIQQTQERPLFSWRGVLIAVLVGLLLATLLIAQSWGAG